MMTRYTIAGSIFDVVVDAALDEEAGAAVVLVGDDPKGVFVPVIVG
jgi:hypothetical protein